MQPWGRIVLKYQLPNLKYNLSTSIYDRAFILDPSIQGILPWIHVKQNDLLLEIRLKMSTIQVVINPSSSYRIQLIQLAISEFWVSVWARFLARSARAKLGSAQLTKFKIWKSSAQLSSPNWKSISARLSSAHYLKGASSAH